MPRPLLIAGFFPPPITGQGLATQRLAELLAEDYEVHTVNLREGETAVDLRHAGRIFRKVAGYRAAGRRLAEAVHDLPEATVLWTAISPEPAGHFRDLLTVAPAFAPDQRVYGVVHWGRFDRLFRSPTTRLTAKRLVDRLAGLVFLNTDRAARCNGWVPPEKRFVIPNTLDRAVLCSDEEIEAKQRDYSDRRPVRLLFLSHMIREKGYMDVLEAVFLLRQRGVAVQAIFAGQWMSDRDRDFFDEFVDAHGLGEFITHLGPVEDRSTVRSLHLASDVFVLPSYMIEGQPLAILEALNAGSPVIASNLGGIVDMIDDGREGYLIPPRSPLAIADAIQQLTPRPHWCAISRAARTRYLLDYSEDVVKEKWRRLVG